MEDVLIRADSQQNSTDIRVDFGSRSQSSSTNGQDTGQLPRGTSTGTDVNQSTSSRIRVQPFSRMRKQLIPRTVRLNIKQRRINDIYGELRRIDVNQNPNTVAISLRVFLEMSLDHYADVNGINNYSVDNKLTKKLDIIATYIEQNNLLDKQQIAPIHKARSDPHSIASINTFNQYVHNRYFPPNPETLKTTWDQLELFIETLWK